MLHEIQVQNNNNNCVINKMEKRTIPIAPAPSKLQTSELMRCRKKMTYKQTTAYPGYQSASIIRRNARERNRVKQVNDGFAALRRHLPPDVVAALSNSSRRGASKKLSKVDTLKMVVEYIRYLQQLLDDEGGEKSENQENNQYFTSSPSNMDHGYMLDQTPPSSETSSSPAPSFTSDVSSGVPGYTNSYFPVDKYEPQINPMDEELLDVISWWQQK